MTAAADTAKAAAAGAGKQKSLIKRVGPIMAASFCAATLMYPLDLIRALQMANAGSMVKQTTGQLLSTFKKTHGWQGFFTQGLAPEVLKATWARFIKFSLYPVVHMAITNGVKEANGNPMTKAAAGILASVPEVITIMPLEIAKIMLQLDSNKKYGNDMFKAMSSVFRDKGLDGFTVGYTGIQLRQSLWTAGYFASLAFFEKIVNQGITCLSDCTGSDIVGKPGTKAFANLLSGFFAGVFGASLNTPFDTIRSSIQKSVFTGGVRRRFVDVGRDIYNARGMGGLYAGFESKAFHLGGGGALMAFLIPFWTTVFEKMDI